MNLTINASLSSMLHKTAELEGAMKSQLEVSQEYNEALEALRSVQAEGNRLSSMLTDLSIAQESLERLGFSDEWLALVNQDGHFFEATNIELSDLLGTIEEKGEIAMEGLWDTIKTVLKKIWDFIIGLIVKIVNFIRSIVSILKTDIRKEESVKKSIDEVKKLCNGGKLPMTEAEGARKVGEKINEFFRTDDVKDDGSRTGAGVTKAYDRRDLLTRCVIDRMLANILMTMTQINLLGSGFSRGSEATDTDLFSPALIEYFSHASTENFFFLRCVEMVNNNPAEALALCKQIQMFEWTGFKTTRVTKDIKKVANSVGVAIHREGCYIAPIDDVLKEIEYATTYTKFGDYLDVSAAIEYNLRSCDAALADYNRGLTELGKYANAINKFIGKYEVINQKEATGDLITPEDEKGLTSAGKADDRSKMLYKLRNLTKWVQECMLACGKLDSDFNTCRSLLSRVGEVYKWSTDTVQKEIANSAK